MIRRLQALLVAVPLVTTIVGAQTAQWKAHDPQRPKPRVVQPANAPGAPPGDAVVLFNGTDLASWRSADGSAPRWTVRDGYMETAPGAGPIVTSRGFGDVQLHIEWATPGTVKGSGQGRGNSGVILMGRYEVQVLDSWQNETYADGQAAAIYGQHPPLVNASRPPGEWQTYDVVFRRPRFGAGGSLASPARMTVFHNGILVHDNQELWGPTAWLEHERYAAHADSLPLLLQDHDNPVRYRNIWVRPLAPPRQDEQRLAESRPALSVPMARLRGYVGAYGTAQDTMAIITLRGGQLHASVFGDDPLPLVPQTASRFTFRRTAGTVEFLETPNAPMRVRVVVAENDREAVRIR